MTIIFVVFVLVAVLVAYIASRPARFRVERSALVTAPSAAVFPLINDFRNWSKWSPWEKLDPGMKKTFGGANSGVGAEYAWAGNGRAGEGRMTVVESRPNTLVVVRLQFLKPFAAINTTTFRLDDAPSGTTVHWIMEGTNGFAAKAFSTFVDTNKMLGKSFDEGLANMNQAARAAAS